jgi:hypothetical protein
MLIVVLVSMWRGKIAEDLVNGRYNILPAEENVKDYTLRFVPNWLPDPVPRGPTDTECHKLGYIRISQTKELTVSGVPGTSGPLGAAAFGPEKRTLAACEATGR